MGLLPFAQCGNPEPPDHGCGFLFDTAQAILAVALSGLEPFIPPDSCGESFEAWVSMNTPVHGYREGLSVHLVNFGQVTDFQGGDCATGMFPRQSATWQVQLWEGCYPTITQDGLPDFDSLNAVNEHVYAHGIAAYEAVVSGWVNKTILLPPQVSSMQVGRMTPLGPEGPSVGWRFDVTTVIG